jgi:hypothetical protein
MQVARVSNVIFISCPSAGKMPLGSLSWQSLQVLSPWPLVKHVGAKSTLVFSHSWAFGLIGIVSVWVVPHVKHVLSLVPVSKHVGSVNNVQMSHECLCVFALLSLPLSGSQVVRDRAVISTIKTFAINNIVLFFINISLIYFLYLKPYMWCFSVE